MRKSYLRRTTLLSLLGISSAQTSSWGEPFAVEPAATTSTDNLLSSVSPTSTWGDAFSVDNSAVVTPSSSLPTSDAAAPSLAVDTSSLGPSDVEPSDVTVISGIQSVVASRSANFGASATGTGTRTGTGSAQSTESATSSGSAASEATGAAASARGFKKMGLAGAIAGAAGVMFM
ncbi:hypothetical protein G6011_02418 [Alternaria panax]|uniref:Uncharacterized protein n=1 Tax=Alternaria panax TaxID=48097 RepID=A0AAD4FFN4_9PLEO|nr:hypothetical protein G6011_02418 [Alternaria panax]